VDLVAFVGQGFAQLRGEYAAAAECGITDDSDAHGCGFAGLAKVKEFARALWICLSAVQGVGRKSQRPSQMAWPKAHH
jgi:hypothetical protein